MDTKLLRRVMTALEAGEEPPTIVRLQLGDYTSPDFGAKIDVTADYVAAAKRILKKDS